MAAASRRIAPVGFGNIIRFTQEEEAASDESFFRISTAKRQSRKHELYRGTEFREVRIRSKDIYTGLVPLSFSAEPGQPEPDTKMLGNESLTEGDFWTVINFTEKRLANAWSQPMRIEVEILGRQRHWIPDALLVFNDGRRPLLVEVKQLSAVKIDREKDPERALWVSAWHRALGRAAEARGCDFALYTDAEIRLEPRFYNSNVMARALSAQVPTAALQKAVGALADLPRPITVSTFAHRLGEYAKGALNIACVLDRLGYIQIDRSTPFRPQSEFVASGAERDEQGNCHA